LLKEKPRNPVGGTGARGRGGVLGRKKIARISDNDCAKSRLSRELPLLIGRAGIVRHM